VNTKLEANQFLEGRHSVVLRLHKARDGWVALIDGSEISPLPHRPMPLRKLQLTVATRYLAEVHGKIAIVNLRWARDLPNWSNNNGLGALPELASAIRRAEALFSLCYTL
jgi:hypothetical protein